MPGKIHWTAAHEAEAASSSYYSDMSPAFRAVRSFGAFYQHRLRMGCGTSYLAREETAPSPHYTSDKKVGEASWRDYAELIKGMQDFSAKRKWTQDHGHIDFSHIDQPICVLAVSDFHLGSWGTDYDALCRITEEIVETPDLYLVILGDMEQMSIKLRNVLEISDNAIPPEWQLDFLESWVNEIADKILFSTWDNHSVMREEAAAGRSAYKRMMSRKAIYFNGIGHADITVGQQTYKVAASHRFRGRSDLHALHSQKKYMRFQGQDREICMAGDSHVPAIEKYVDGVMEGRPKDRLALNAGTLQTNSGYAKRFFSLATSEAMPCFTLHPEKHLFSPYWSLQEWMENKG